MKLKEMRLKSGYSQKELAELVGINFRSYQNYEQGVRKIDNTDIATLLNICIILKCNIKDIIEDENTIELLDRYSKIN